MGFQASCSAHAPRIAIRRDIASANQGVASAPSSSTFVRRATPRYGLGLLASAPSDPETTSHRESALAAGAQALLDLLGLPQTPPPMFSTSHCAAAGFMDEVSSMRGSVHDQQPLRDRQARGICASSHLPRDLQMRLITLTPASFHTHHRVLVGQLTHFGSARGPKSPAAELIHPAPNGLR